MQELAKKPDPDAPANDLDLPIWSVISFNGCERASLSYDDAADLIGVLDAQGVPGLSIVTDAAAERITRRRSIE